MQDAREKRSRMNFAFLIDRITAARGIYNHVF